MSITSAHADLPLSLSVQVAFNYCLCFSFFWWRSLFSMFGMEEGVFHALACFFFSMWNIEGWL
jgi:hypothetical protein